MLTSLLLTLLSKLLTFILSTLTLRFLDVEAFGEASINYELLLSTCLFLGREPIRLACVRGAPRGNTHLLSPLLVSTIAAGIYAFYPKLPIALYCLSTILESLAEPQIITLMRQGDVAVKARGEMIAVITKSVTLYALLTTTTTSLPPMMCFAFSQIVYATTFALFVYSRGPRIDLSVLTEPHFPSLRLSASFFFQSLFKNLLTEGDKLVLTTLASSYDGGIYAMAFSYGSLVGRILLQPLEENARLLFGKRGAKKKTLAKQFTTLMKFASYLGIVFATFGRTYSYIVLKVLAGKKYDNEAGVSALGAMCVYQLFLSINGLSEAFLYASLQTGGEVRRSSMLLMATNVVYGVLAVVGVGRMEGGVVGLIAANSFAMAMRASYAIWASQRYLGESVVGAMVPNLGCLSVVVAFCGTERLLRNSLMIHLAFGVFAFLLFAAAIFVREKDFLRALKGVLDDKKKK